MCACVTRTRRFLGTIRSEERGRSSSSVLEYERTNETKHDARGDLSRKRIDDNTFLPSITIIHHCRIFVVVVAAAAAAAAVVVLLLLLLLLLLRVVDRRRRREFIEEFGHDIAGHTGSAAFAGFTAPPAPGALPIDPRTLDKPFRPPFTDPRPKHTRLGRTTTADLRRGATVTSRGDLRRPRLRLRAAPSSLHTPPGGTTRRP